MERVIASAIIGVLTGAGLALAAGVRHESKLGFGPYVAAIIFGAYALRAIVRLIRSESSERLALTRSRSRRATLAGIIVAGTWFIWTAHTMTSDAVAILIALYLLGLADMVFLLLFTKPEARLDSQG
jgi:hypothetical protein